MISIFKGQAMSKEQLEEDYNKVLKTEIEKIEKKEA